MLSYLVIVSFISSQIAVSAQSLNHENFFFGGKSFRQRNIGNGGLLNARGHVAVFTIEMHMIVVMMLVLAGRTNSILGLKLLIGNSVENTYIQKLFQTTVNGGTVDLPFKFLFQVGVRQGMGIR